MAATRPGADSHRHLGFFQSARYEPDVAELRRPVQSANEMVCCIYPFNIDKRFQLVFGEDKPYLRYILLDARKGYNTFQTNDRDVEVVAGSYIDSDLDQWAAEKSAGSLFVFRRQFPAQQNHFDRSAGRYADRDLRFGELQ